METDTQPFEKEPGHEFASAVRHVQPENRSALSALGQKPADWQRRFSQLVRALVDDLLAPYAENTEDPQYLEFIDCTADCRKSYETEGEVFIRMLDGKMLPAYDLRVYRDYIVHEGKVYKRSFGPLHHRKRTKKAKRMRTQYIPNKQRFADFEEFAEQYCGFRRGPGSDAFGYYTNPNGRWDWYQVGGRWPDRFLVKADCRIAVAGDLSYSLVGETGVDAPEGYCWVAGARKCDIAWDVMKSHYIQAATERFHVLETYYLAGNIPQEAFPLFITDKGIESWSGVLYAKGETLEAYLHRLGLSESFRYPISTVACLGDEGWLEIGEMGWFGMLHNKQDENTWNETVERFIETLSEDTMLVSVDCHT